jgi:ribonuclease PH
MRKHNCGFLGYSRCRHPNARLGGCMRSWKVDDTVVLDLFDAEDKLGAADVPVAIMPNLNAVTLLQMDGILTSEEFEKAVNMAD